MILYFIYPIPGAAPTAWPRHHAAGAVGVPGVPGPGRAHRPQAAVQGLRRQEGDAQAQDPRGLHRQGHGRRTEDHLRRGGRPGMNSVMI